MAGPVHRFPKDCWRFYPDGLPALAAHAGLAVVEQHWDRNLSDPQWADIAPIVLISLALAFVATIYPSWRASRVNPAEALRYE